MSQLVIEGGHTLSGSIRPQGAKNEALQVLCASLLAGSDMQIENVPNIRDVNYLIDLLSLLGATVTRLNSSTLRIGTQNIRETALSAPEVLEMIPKLRGSILLLGPLLGRFGRVLISRPQGDKIGRRRLDTHINGLIALGARFEYNHQQGTYLLVAKRLKGAKIVLEEASVTGTANLIMAAQYATGETEIYNAACDPYVQQLCNCINSMGGHITGIGSNRLLIQGSATLTGVTHRLQPDMIEMGSFIGMAALTRSKLRIKNIAAIEDYAIVPMFEQLGINIVKQDGDLIVDGTQEYAIQPYIDGSFPSIRDGPWPGLSPDVLSIGIVTALQADGAVLFHQHMFESRLFFTDKLIQMGGRLILCDPHRVVVVGMAQKHKLHGIRMSSPDIRAGVALLIAALSAEGESIIDNVEQIDRGYEQIEVRLGQIGAKIRRTDHMYNK